MSNHPPISFGDHVRVRSTPDTDAVGVAGQTGQVYGETMPSVTGVAVVGFSDEDYAFNVHFEGRKDTLWFAPDLLEFVDHAAGTEIQLEGVSKTWVRSAGGNWVEASQKKPWWKFW